MHGIKRLMYLLNSMSYFSNGWNGIELKQHIQSKWLLTYTQKFVPSRCY